MSDKRFRDDDGKLDLGKIKRYEDSSYKVLLLLKYIEEQQDTIQSLKEENDNCRNDYRELFSNYVALEEENRKLKKRLRKCANNWKQEIVEKGKLEEEIEQLKIIGVINDVLYE